MSDPNPYESPRAQIEPTPAARSIAYSTRGKAFLAGLWRGAKLGFVTMSACYVLFILVANDLAPDMERVIERAQAVKLVELLLSVVVAGVVPVALAFAVIAAMRWHPPSKSNET